MLKGILKLEGATVLAKEEQKAINGGKAKCMNEYGECEWYSRYCAEPECTVRLEP